MNENAAAEPPQTDFDRKLKAARDAMDEMPDPEPASSRQVIIALRNEIKAKARGHGLEALHKVFFALGHKVTLGTFRDYVYNGETSQKAVLADDAATKKKRRISATTTKVADKPSAVAFSLPESATESTAGGRPVTARKML